MNEAYSLPLFRVTDWINEKYKGNVNVEADNGLCKTNTRGERMVGARIVRVEHLKIKREYLPWCI